MKLLPRDRKVTTQESTHHLTQSRLNAGCLPKSSTLSVLRQKIQAYLNAPLPNKSKGAPKGYLKLQTINHGGKQNLQGEVWQAMHCLYIECFK